MKEKRTKLEKQQQTSLPLEQSRASSPGIHLENRSIPNIPAASGSAGKKEKGEGKNSTKPNPN